MNEAAMAALDEKLVLVQSCSGSAPLTIRAAHFERALGKISPSVSDKVPVCFVCVCVCVNIYNMEM